MLIPLLPAVVGVATPWVRYREAQALREGVPLAEPEVGFAERIGIQNPRAVRLLKVEAVRAFEHPLLRAAFFGVDRAFRHTAGLTLRYGILIRADYWDRPGLIAHELVHVLQYERLGGIAPFLHAYFLECLLQGYPLGPLEQEAVIRGREHVRE